MSRRPAAVVATVALLFAGPVRASEPASVEAPAGAPAPVAYDSVVLRDGTMLRGTIVELSPGRQVVLDVPGAGPRTIAWAEVASTQLAGQAAQAVPAASPAPGPEGPVPADSEPPPGPSRPRLFIEVTRPAEVHLLEAGWPAPAYGGYPNSRAGMYAAARSVCRAPCGRVIDGSSGNPFFFGGSRTLPSRIFFLKDLEGDYVARVRPGRLGLLMGGIFVTSLGYAGALSGGVLMGITKDPETRLGGGIAFGLGLALLASGIAMLVHGTTRYTLRRR